MVSVEIIETGEMLEITQGSVTYVFQAADIGDVTKTNASYSHNFTTPKTPENTRILENLGIKGDTSTTPYRRIYCRLLDNGTAIVERGLMNITETSDTYKINIQSGIVEFFRDVTNDKVGEVLDLSDLRHRNTPENIISSFKNEKSYKYLIADFRGPTLVPLEGMNTTNLDPAALIPSVNVGEVLDRLMDYYGWSYEGMDYRDLWLTYPTTLAYDSEQADVIFSNTVKLPEIPKINDERMLVAWSGSSQVYLSDFVYLEDIATVAVERPGTYIVSFEVAGKLLNPNAEGGHYYYAARLYHNGELISEKNPEKDVTQNLLTTQEVTVDLQKGDRLRLYLEPKYPFLKLPAGSVPDITASMQVQAVGIRTVDFREALIKFKVSDFFKELMIRKGLAVFVDLELKKMQFLSIEQRTSAEIIDWSLKYVKRINERYTHGSEYAQNNYLKHKYDEEGEDYRDGNIRVNNDNLEREKDLFQSQSYAPAAGFGILETEEGNQVNVNILKMFEAEVRAENGEQGQRVLVEYKGLKDRFFFVKENWINDTIYLGGLRVEGFPVATMEGTTMQAVVNEHYGELQRIVEGTRIHNIDLVLSKYDVAALDLRKRYYFEQENAVYLLNRLTWKSGGIATGEFIKLKI